MDAETCPCKRVFKRFITTTAECTMLLCNTHTPHSSLTPSFTHSLIRAFPPLIVHSFTPSHAPSVPPSLLHTITITHVHVHKSTAHLMKHLARMCVACSEQWAGRLGTVSSMTILNMAAVGSNSYHGGWDCNISTTVAPTLLEGHGQCTCTCMY